MIGRPLAPPNIDPPPTRQSLHLDCHHRVVHSGGAAHRRLRIYHGHVRVPLMRILNIEAAVDPIEISRAGSEARTDRGGYHHRYKYASEALTSGFSVVHQYTHHDLVSIFHWVGRIHFRGKD